MNVYIGYINNEKMINLVTRGKIIEMKNCKEHCAPYMGDRLTAGKDSSLSDILNNNNTNDIRCPGFVLGHSCINALLYREDNYCRAGETGERT